MNVIGLGNEWRRDDGAGLEVARRTGGRQLDGEPVALVEALVGADEVTIVDAVSSGAPAGTVHEFEAGAEPLPVRLFGASSTHALGLAEALELARSLGRLPTRVRVLGIEGARFDYGRGLSPEVEAAVERCTRSI
ncbi:MAG TPA: hydrogenase maturation protease [Gaiellaceae bacterium]|jgi:hydrogenase maturation protease